MAKRTKKRAAKRARKAEWKRELASMSPEQKAEFNARRIRTAKSGFAKRQRERANGAPMESRTHEGVRKRFVTPQARACPEFAPWLRGFQRMTVAA